MDRTPVEFDPFRSGELARTAPSTEPQREVISSACLSERANTAFNEAVSLRLAGRLDPETVDTALRAIVDRHEALRMTFTPLGDEVCIAGRAAFALERLDVTAASESEREERVGALWRELVGAPMNLHEGPLFRAIWVRLSDDLAELILLAHHAVCDGWSFHVVLEELSRLCAGVAVDALPPAPSFADFAERQVARAAANADVDYWVERFEPKPPVLDLPADRTRGATRSFAAARIDHAFDPRVVEAIAGAAGKLKASVVQVALAGTAALLHRLTDATDMAIGLPVARQSTEDLPGLVGHAVQLLPIRLQAGPGDSFADLVGRAKAGILDAREHSDFTFGTLVRELGLSGGRARVPLVPVVFNIDQPFAELKLGAASARLRSVPRTAENFEIFLNVVPGGNRLVIEATFNTDLFSPDTMRSWLRALECLLADATHDPGKPLAELRLAAQVPQAYAQLNDTARAHPAGTWLHRLRDVTARQPGAIAAGDSSGSLTYAELALRSDALAETLAQRGVTRGSVVGIYMARSCDLLVALAGVHKAGAAYLPLDPSFPESRLAFMLRDSGAELVLADVDLPSALTKACRQALRLPHSASGASSKAALPIARAEDLAYVIYTSGSTGKPKGVEVAHGAVANLLDSMAARPGFGDADTLLAVTTLSFDISVLELLLPLTRGGRVVVASREDAADAGRLAALLAEHAVTVMQATPSTWRLLLESAWAGSTTLTAFCGGEPLAPDLAGALLGKVNALWNLYGPTETTIWSTCKRIFSGEDPISIGRPVDNTSVYIMDAHGQPLPPGVPGEIWIGGAGLARGYRARPELTDERFVDHPRLGRLYRTGDRGRLLERGVIEHLGRLDFQVKVRGYRIELGEIEAALVTHPEVAQAVVVAREDRPGDVRLAAYLVARSGIAEDALRAHLESALPAYMIPQHFVVLPAIPLLPNGKVDRSALPAPEAALRPRSEHVPPRTALERSIACAMEEILARTGIGVDDNFFSVGGHSLLASQLALRLGRELDIDVPMRAVFEAPTTAELATWIERHARSDHAPRAVIARRAERRTAPLSLMQQRIWFLEQLNPGRAVFNVPAAHRLRGTLDERAFARAFAEMVRRQEALRTAIKTVDGAPVQVIAPQVPCDLLPVQDLRDVPGAERERVLRERLDALIAAPFDLGEAPLFRARLFRLDEEEHAFFFMAHHIIWDGWSFDLVYREMAALYGAFHEGRRSPLPDLSVSYGDFCAWHRDRMQGEELAAQLAHWKARLACPQEPLAIPTDRPRPARMSGNGRTAWMSLPAASVERLRELGQRADATLFMALLALYVLLLRQLTGQKDIVIGTPVRGRARAELDPIMGFFVNALPLRFRVADDASFLELLQQVRACVIDAFAYPDVPLEQLLRELNVPRDESRSPIYQAMFSFQDARRREPRWGNLEHSRIPVMQQAVGEDTGLWFVELPSGLTGGLTYSTDILSDGTAKLLGERYVHLLGAVLAAPGEPISRLPLPEAERRQLLAWNATASAFDRRGLMQSRFEAQARRAPERVALRHGEAEISYGELDARANRLARVLRARGAGRGCLVGLCIERGIDMVLAQLAVLKSGAAYVPLDPFYPEERLRFMARDAGLALLVSTSSLAPGCGLPREHQFLLDVDAVQIAAQPPTPLALDKSTARPEDPAYVIYTSGSTGNPKGVVVPHRAVVNFLASMARAPGLAADDVLVAVTTLSFDIAVLELHLPLAVGASAVIAAEHEASSGPLLSALIERHRAGIMQATPVTWRLLIEAGWKGGERFKALVGGEALSSDLAGQLLERTGELWNMYGPTETTVWSTCARITGTDRGISIGKPIANTTVYILDPELKLCPVGVAGELWIGGEGVALGYWNQPELSAERFIPDAFGGAPGSKLYRTGDRARWRQDGTLEYLGRLDFQVKIRGYRIELAEIEARLTQHPVVREAVVLAREDVPGDRRLVAYVATLGAPADLAGELRAHLRASLPEYMVPAAFIALEALPLTPNGKVDRRALPAPALDSVARPTGTIAPRSATERMVHGHFRSVLERSDVCVFDSFFDIGGHSLVAAQLIFRLQAETGLDLPLRTLFERPTVVGLAEAIDGLTWLEPTRAPVRGTGAREEVEL